MTAAVETMAYSGQVPWHGIGKNVSSDKQHTTEEWIEDAGLNWKVGMFPLTIMSKEQMMKFGIPQDIAEKYENLHGEFVDRYCTVRMSDGSRLGSVGPAYTVLQNHDAFSWFQPFIDNGQCTVETAGALYNGQKVWVLAKINRNPGMVDQDVLNKYLLLSNSHDGTMAVRIGTTMTRVVCANTLTAAIRDKASKLIRIRHTSSLNANLKNIRESIDAINDEMNATVSLYNKLRSKSINQNDLRKYVKLVLEVDTEKPDSELSTRLTNTIDRIVGYAHNSPGCEGKNYFDAVQGVSYYVTHIYGRTNESRLDSAWFGVGNKMNQRALTIATDMAM